MLIEKKVDYTSTKNMILTAVTMISGLSGAAVNIGPVQLKGMGLAVVCGMILSFIFIIVPILCPCAQIIMNIFSLFNF